jgi:hypothetical protein
MRVLPEMQDKIMVFHNIFQNKKTRKEGRRGERELNGGLGGEKSEIYIQNSVSPRWRLSRALCGMTAPLRASKNESLHNKYDRKQMFIVPSRDWKRADTCTRYSGPVF